MDEKESYEVFRRRIEASLCNLCECPPTHHICYWACPIFNGESICQECCHDETTKDDVDKKFSEKLGRPITKEEINKMCRDCGRNNGMQKPKGE